MIINLTGQSDHQPDTADIALGLTVGRNRYHVGWEIDIWADTPREAAEKALALHRKPDSTATVFAVTDEVGDEVTIDLLDEVPA